MQIYFHYISVHQPKNRHAKFSWRLNSACPGPNSDQDMQKLGRLPNHGITAYQLRLWTVCFVGLGFDLISACPGLSSDQDMQNSAANWILHVYFWVDVLICNENSSACPGRDPDQDMQRVLENRAGEKNMKTNLHVLVVIRTRTCKGFLKIGPVKKIWKLICMSWSWSGPGHAKGSWKSGRWKRIWSVICMSWSWSGPGHAKGFWKSGRWKKYENYSACPGRDPDQDMQRVYENRAGEKNMKHNLHVLVVIRTRTCKGL